LSQLLSKVTVTSCSFYIKMLNVSSLLLYDALKPATPLTDGAINETLRHTLFDISQGSVNTLVIYYYAFSPDSDSEVILKID